MSEYTATIAWRRNGATFSDKRYSRKHAWIFDGGTEVAASSSPHVVPAPLSDPSAIDPEEAFVAAISSCHMLWFLSIACKPFTETINVPRTSAGLLMYRINIGMLQVLLAHPGGPFFKNKDDGAWSIPKGEPDPGEDLFLTALREFEEETGFKPQPPFVPLKPIQQKGGKIVHAWAFAGDCDPTAIKSNLFTMEWPARSGQQMQFPEIDRAEFFDLGVARKKIKAAQAALIDELEVILKDK